MRGTAEGRTESETQNPPRVALRRRLKEPRMPIDATRPYDDSNIFARILRGSFGRRLSATRGGF